MNMLFGIGMPLIAVELTPPNNTRYAAVIAQRIYGPAHKKRIKIQWFGHPSLPVLISGEFIRCGAMDNIPRGWDLIPIKYYPFIDAWIYKRRRFA